MHIDERKIRNVFQELSTANGNDNSEMKQLKEYFAHSFDYNQLEEHYFSREKD